MSGGATGWSHVRRCSGVSSGPHTPMGYLLSDLGNGLLRTEVYMFQCAGAGSGDEVRRTLLGPGVAFLGSGLVSLVGSC